MVLQILNQIPHEFAEVDDPSGRYGRYDGILGKGASKTIYRAFDEYDGLGAKLHNFLQIPEETSILCLKCSLLLPLREKKPDASSAGSPPQAKVKKMSLIRRGSRRREYMKLGSFGAAEFRRIDACRFLVAEPMLCMWTGGE
ncbi:hypothetical protein Vadar_002851 [Vaccinium darrowii]|uniref:Uncharacterized protein n=1 Tax=Vaccinium darrowii TaxID=229202 RepID=A0ACB7WXW1_9ERIC|nr:hypothetical protein Vadar_002851 [Vaccinium darrowii]